MRFTKSLLSALSVGIAVALFFVLREAFSGRLVVDPVAISAGPVQIHWYGIFIALGIVIALEWTARRAVTRGLDRALVETASWWTVICGIIGARLGYVLQNLGYFTAHPDRIIAVTDGGLSIHGALVGGAFALWLAIFVSSPKIPLSPLRQLADQKGEVTPSFRKGGSGRISQANHMFLQLTDAAIPGLLLAMILGRFGNFTNHELFGPPTDLPWKMFVPMADRPAGMEAILFYHPTFLYDALLNAGLLCVLLALDSRHEISPSPSLVKRGDVSTSPFRKGGSRGISSWWKRSDITYRPGQLTRYFFLSIAITRFIVEFWRLGDTLTFGLSLAQLVSLLIALSASLGIFCTHRRR